MRRPSGSIPPAEHEPATRGAPRIQRHAARTLGSPKRSEGARIEIDWSARQWTASTSKVPRNVTTVLVNEGNGRDPRHPGVDPGHGSTRAVWLQAWVATSAVGVTATTE
ncbi:MAG: hypothetical protein CMJ27_01755 [Phycisphaerae bacterium]|nr:hypothetical protein [Phycisphaerae bacterium]OUX02993.1 MAG: hypothetical protein CBD91_01195 [Phycisphaeraceae bacterium TMED231]